MRCEDHSCTLRPSLHLYVGVIETLAKRCQETEMNPEILRSKSRLGDTGAGRRGRAEEVERGRREGERER